jgi:hypothetical protein
MSTAIGLRDQRLRLYERREEGSDGFSRPVFYFSGEWWGRIDTISAMTREIAGAGAFAQGVTMAALFSDEINVPINGVLRHEDDIYFVTSVYKARLLRRIVVALEALTREQVQVLKLYDTEVADGTHIVEPY